MSVGFQTLAIDVFLLN